MCAMESTWGEKPAGGRLPLRKYSGRERRHLHRHRLTCLKVIYRRPLLLLFKAPASEPCPISNITSRGVKFYTFKRLRIRSVVEVKFDAPVGVYRVASGNQVKAKIIWQQWSEHRKAWRTGAQFVHLSKSTHDDLARMMQDAALHSSRF